MSVGECGRGCVHERRVGGKSGRDMCGEQSGRAEWEGRVRGE